MHSLSINQKLLSSPWSLYVARLCIASLLGRDSMYKIDNTYNIWIGKGSSINFVCTVILVHLRFKILGDFGIGGYA